MGQGSFYARFFHTRVLKYLKFPCVTCEKIVAPPPPRSALDSATLLLLALPGGNRPDSAMGGIPYGDDNVCMHVHEVTHDLVVRTAADSFTGQSSLSLKPGSVCRGVCVCVCVCVCGVLQHADRKRSPRAESEFVCWAVQREFR